MAKEKDEFNFINLPPEANDPSISKDDFKFVQAESKIKEQKFQTKPTTFLKDCFKRFCKNKSSVVAAIILGVLVVLSVAVPIIGKINPIYEGEHTGIDYLEPKLFPAGTGFWDGTKKMVDIPCDSSDPNPDNWRPSSDFVWGAVSNFEHGVEQYTKKATKFGKGGYVQLGYYESFPEPQTDKIGNVKYKYLTMASKKQIEKFDFENELKITNFDVYDKQKLANSSEEIKDFPVGYEEGKVSLSFTFQKSSEQYYFDLTEEKTSFDIGGGEPAIDVQKVFNDFYDENAATLGWTDKKVINPILNIRVKNENTKEVQKNVCTLIRSINIDAPADEESSKQFRDLSFEDGNKCMIRTTKDAGMWECKESVQYGSTAIYLSRGVLCSFTYDTYEAALGYLDSTIAWEDLNSYIEDNLIEFNPGLVKIGSEYVPNPDLFVCKILDPDCPIAVEFEQKDINYNKKTGYINSVDAKVFKYRQTYGLSKMPIFLFGTDHNGRDMLVYVFEGLRTSLLLGLATTIVCFIFGLFWGSVSGYFGGTVDLIMERLTDILSGIPWIVLMTLVVIKLGQDLRVLAFVIALCLTGWIGTAATTRTQFYRFRGREYVLASRTLGASHGRLIAKHILPNAMGTIITSAVLMVPSVIFSEATLSFLGLGFQGISSLGVTLSRNQLELTDHPYLLIFPSVIIALLMISFNLFGNGLRDAVNPSLKGEGE